VDPWCSDVAFYHGHSRLVDDGTVCIGDLYIVQSSRRFGVKIVSVVVAGDVGVGVADLKTVVAGGFTSTHRPLFGWTAVLDRGDIRLELGSTHLV